MKWLLIPALISCLGLAAAGPEDSAKPRPAGGEEQAKARFEKADKNHDGKLTREEAKEGMPRVFANFDRIDHDRKGYLTLEDVLRALRNKK